MGNRTMAAKAMKLRRQKRAWAKPLAIRSGISPNVEVIQQYQRSAKGLAEPSDEFLNQLVASIWKKPVVQGISEPRKAILDVLVRIKEDVPEFFFRTILQNQYQRVRAYHNSLEDVWVVVHEDFRKHFIRRSTEYSSLVVAKYRWEQKRICWVHQRALPVPDLPPLYSG